MKPKKFNRNQILFHMVQIQGEIRSYLKETDEGEYMDTGDVLSLLESIEWRTGQALKMLDPA